MDSWSSCNSITSADKTPVSVSSKEFYENIQESVEGRTINVEKEFPKVKIEKIAGMAKQGEVSEDSFKLKHKATLGELSDPSDNMRNPRRI